MNEHELIDQFLSHWQSINRHLRRGILAEGSEQITRLQWMLLRHVSRTQTCTIGQLAEKFGVRPSTVSQMADRLEKSGLIYRITDTEDARLRFVRLTEKGQTLINHVKSLWAERLSEGLSQFSKEEQQNLIELLDRLATSLVEPR